MKGITFLSGFISSILISGSALPAFSQVTSDNTTNTTINQNGNNFNVINGIQKGNNLFHSFKEFSIPTGGSAVFSNSNDVVNIINRVTGGNISNIDGLIKSLGNANLFLINPSGIVFGENSKLDIGGSFFGSTAESILFEDGFEFCAVNAENTPLLTVSIPIGLQMGNNSAAIELQGNGYTAASNGNLFSPLIVTNINGLRVKQGNTLALVGSEISLDGGIVAADSGRIELGGVSSGLVNINSTTQGWNLDYRKDSIQSFGDIKLSSKALANTSGTRSGLIQLQGRNISLKDGSTVFVQNQGLNSGGEIKLNATESIEVVGTSLDGNLVSRLLTETIGVGNSAEIAISTPNLLVSQDGGIVTRSFNSGTAGDINISTNQLSLLLGGIFSNSLGFGSGGDISVSTDKLTSVDGGIISSVTLGLGSGGNIDVNAKSIELIGYNPKTFIPSSLSSGTVGVGKAASGSLTINTGNLVVRNGGRVDSSTFAFGAAGSVTINATDFVEVSGTVTDLVNPSLIISSADVADELSQQVLRLPAIPSGDSGNININTPIFKVSDGAEVTVRNDGTGSGGILNINADSILMNNKGKITASTQSGGGGDINLQVKNSFILRNQSLIDSESFGMGDGGNININSPVIASFENSDIIANAVEGNGGNIDITTQGIFGLEFRDQLTSESDITASSQFGVNGTVKINNIGINPSSGLVELNLELADSSQQISTGCSSNTGNSFVATGKGGIPQSPQEQFNINHSWSDIRDLSGFIKDNNAVETANISNQTAIIEATGFIRNSKGEIELVAVQNEPLNTKQLSDCSGINT